MTIQIKVQPGATCNKDDTGKKIWKRPFVLFDDSGTETEASTAWAAAYAAVKTTYKIYDGLHAKSVDFDELSDGARRIFKFSVTYTVNGDLENEEQTSPVKGTLRFSTKGGTKHINSALSHVSTYPANNNGVLETAPDYNGLINVQNGVANGIDVQAPALHIDVTCKIPTTMITTAWLSSFYELTGCVNSTVLWSFPIGTLIFRGLDGSTDGQGTCNLTFSFDYSPNFSGTVDPFDAISKKGWEYAWTSTKLITDSTTNLTIPRPVGMYIEKVYEEKSFSPFTFITIA